MTDLHADIETALHHRRLRKEQVYDANSYLKWIERDGLDVPDEDTELLRQVVARGGWAKLGPECVTALLNRVRVPLARALHREEGEKLGIASFRFTPEERRLILAALHPDNSASAERRAEAFRIFLAKVTDAATAK